MLVTCDKVSYAFLFWIQQRSRHFCLLCYTFKKAGPLIRRNICIFKKTTKISVMSMLLTCKFNKENPKNTVFRPHKLVLTQNRPTFLQHHQGEAGNNAACKSQNRPSVKYTVRRCRTGFKAQNRHIFCSVSGYKIFVCAYEKTLHRMQGFLQRQFRANQNL